MKEKPFVTVIFDFKDTGFTVRSKRYQAVLKFFSMSVDDPYSHFKITNVQDVVLSEAPSLFGIGANSKPSDSKKKEHNRFSNILDDLETWGLISSRGAKTITGGAPTKEFRITNLGCILALIVRYYDSENRQEVYDKFYDNWMMNLKKFPTSLNFFLATYLEKCKSNGLFHIFVDNFIHSTIRVWNERVRNEIDLLTQMALIKTDDEDKNKILLGLWLYSVCQLDDSVRIIFLDHMRIHINRFIEKRVEALDKYELKRYENRELDNHIIAELKCSSCNIPKYMELPVVNYLICIFVKDEETDDLIANIKCDNCDKVGFLTLNPII